VVETLNIVDTGTSVLLDAHVRADFTAETALEAVALTLAKYGCPKLITLDRDGRWVGSPAGSDFPAALIRFCACLDVQVQVCAPHHPEQNAFVERYNRTYQEECLAPSSAWRLTASPGRHRGLCRALECGATPSRSRLWQSSTTQRLSHPASLTPTAQHDRSR